MSHVLKYTGLLVFLILVLVVVVGQFIEVRELGYQHNGHTANTGELISGSLVGQTFVADKDNLSGVGVMFATYSGRDNTGQVEFHLKRTIDDSVDLRFAKVDVGSLGDNQFYKFEFEPVPASKGETFFFYVESTDGQAGRAVTVDVDSRDPYHLGSAYIVSGMSGDDVFGETIARSGKVTVDVVFENYYTVSLRTYVTNKGMAAGRNFLLTWGERQSLYAIWAKVAGQAILLIGFLLMATALFGKDIKADLQGPALARNALLVLFMLAIAARVIYAVEMPVTNDEGNYLYDARTLLQGNLAGGDGYVKAPLVILWVALWQLLGNNSVIIGRLSSVVIGALTVFPIYVIGREMVGRRVGLGAATLWALLGVTTVYSIYVHTQPLAIFFGVSGVAVLMIALRGTTPRLFVESVKKRPANISWFLSAGILFGLGVVSRKSILALGLVPLVLILLESKSWKIRLRHLLTVGVGFIVVVGILLTYAGYTYGVEGFWEAIGFNSAEDGINAVDPAEAELVRAYSIRGMTPFFRESLPLILLAVIGLGIEIERLFRVVLLKWIRGGQGKMGSVFGYIIPKFGWLLAIAVFWWAWGFFVEYEGSAAMIFNMRELWYAMFGVMIVVALLPYKKERDVAVMAGKGSEVKKRELPPNVPLISDVPKSEKEFSLWAEMRGHVVNILVPVMWIGGLVFFYMNWIKFHANYIGEFLPPLVLIAGLGATAIWTRLVSIKWVAVRSVASIIILGVLFWSLFTSGFVTYMNEHTGTFDVDAANEAANWAKENIPMEEPIFTGAALIPYLSGHHTALDIAHPRWYAYEFTRRDPARLGTFLPPAEEMLQAYRDANWFLLDKQTGFSFMMEYIEIEAGLERDWERVHGVSNGSNTLTFYRRIRN